MKKFLLSLLSLLLLGGNLAWGQRRTVSGTIIILATEAEKAQLGGIKLIVGHYSSGLGADVSLLSAINLPAETYEIPDLYNNDPVWFGLGTDKKMAYNDSYKAENWVFVDETGAEVNPMTVTEKGVTTVNLTIKYKGAGGGGDDTPKGTLIGKVWDGSDCLAGVTVAISNAEGYSAQQTTRSDAGKYDDKVGCSVGYEFTGLALGTYSLTYSKNGWTTETQEVEITEEGEKIAPAVTLAAAPSNYVFYGSLTYMNADNEMVYVTGATVTAYDGAGEDANILGTAETNGEADWNMTLSCMAGATVYFGAAHPDIEVAERTVVQATNPQGIEVTIACTAKVSPPTPPAEPDSFDVRLQVNNPEWGTVTGEGRYEENEEVTVTATANEGYEFKAWKAGEIQIAATAEYKFTIDRDTALTAVFEAVQTLPDPPTPPVVPDSFDVRLQVNNPEWGTVTGEGRYEDGSEVTVTATANEGYEFKEWKSGEIQIATTAEYKFTIDRDTALTAVFEAMQTPPPVVPDSFDVTLHVNDAAMGTVTGEGRYKKGSRVSIKAVANEGYAFKAWKAGETEIVTLAEYKFIIDRDTALTAVFEAMQTPPPVVPDSFNLRLLVKDPVMGTVTGAGRYEEGTEVTIKATANEGYGFVAWISGNDTLAKTAEYRFALVSDSTLTAVFKVDGTPEPPVANEDREQAAWNVYAENHTIVLRSEAACRYEVYAVSGKRLGQGRNNGNEYRITVENSGIYIIRRIAAKGVSVKKVMVR